MKRYISFTLIILGAMLLGACRKENKADSIPTGVIKVTPEVKLPDNPDHLVVVDFSATWCGPCQKFAPIFDEVAEDYAGRVEFYSVDVDDNNSLAEEYGVFSIPTVIFFLPDGLTSRTVGFLTKEELTTIIDSMLSV